MFIQEKNIWNDVVCAMAAILSRHQAINKGGSGGGAGGGWGRGWGCLHNIMSVIDQGLLSTTWINLIPAWIRNYIH